MPVLASVLKKLTVIIRVAIKCTVYAGILLVFVSFQLFLIKSDKNVSQNWPHVHFDGKRPEPSLRCFISLAY